VQVAGAGFGKMAMDHAVFFSSGSEMVEHIFC
jgi:hypothetical protein